MKCKVGHIYHYLGYIFQATKIISNKTVVFRMLDRGDGCYIDTDATYQLSVNTNFIPLEGVNELSEEVKIRIMRNINSRC